MVDNIFKYSCAISRIKTKTIENFEKLVFELRDNAEKTHYFAVEENKIDYYYDIDRIY